MGINTIYNICTHPFNMRVYKIFVPIIREYPFIISIFYPLRILSTNTCRYKYF